MVGLPRELLLSLATCLRFLTVSALQEKSCNGNSVVESESPPTFEEPTDISPFAYALDPTMTQKLAYLEESIVESLLATVSSPQMLPNSTLCYPPINYYLSEYNKDSAAIAHSTTTDAPRAVFVADNPLLTYRIIQRMTMVLGMKIFQSCPEEVEVAIWEIFSQSELSLPSAEDLHDAVLGILRIQYIYDLSAKDIRVGILNGIQTGVRLSLEDCWSLALAAMEMVQADVLAYQWLMAATAAKAEIKASSKDSSSNMAHPDLEDAWKQLVELTGLESKNVVQRLYQKKKQRKMDFFYDFENYATCRGETAQAPQVFCYYELHWNHYFYINPVKVEVLSFSPVIAQIYNLVEEPTIDYMFEECTKTITRATVINDETGTEDIAVHRAAMSCWLEERESPILTKLNKKFEKLTGLKVVGEKGTSQLQMVIYGSLGFYNFHLDSLQGMKNVSLDGGDREATILLYLSDVEAGGYTAFPRVGTFARPVKGSAVLFYPTLLNGKPDERTLHGGCPVILGSKIVANKWILQRDNMFKQPCSVTAEV